MSTRMPIEERRLRLAEAALEVARRSGVAGATSRAVVAEAGMPLGALHYAFESREELLTTVVQLVTDRERGTVAEVLQGSAGGGVEDILDAGLSAWLDFVVADPTQELVFLELVLYGVRQDLEADDAPSRYAQVYASAAETLEAAAELAGTTWTVPTGELARILVAALDGITTGYLADRDERAARRTAAHIALSLAAFAAPASAS